MSDLEEKFAKQWADEGLPSYERNYQPWLPHRAFEVDFALPALKLGIEIEGGIFMRKSGHSTGTGIARDIDKHNLAVFTGWTLIRVTPPQVANGEGIAMAKRLILGGELYAGPPDFLLMKPKERKIARRKAKRAKRSPGRRTRSVSRAPAARLRQGRRERARAGA